MATLNEHSSRVLAEFGGRIPPHILQFEDARREFLQTRALELQRLGISDTDKTVRSAALNVSARDGAVPSSFGNISPAFVEYLASGGTYNYEKVEIVPVEKIPEFEGGRAIAFYGSPLRYRTSFSFWENGTVTLWYDRTEDLYQIFGDDEVRFADAFTTYLVKKAAFNLCAPVTVNLALHSAPKEDERLKIITNALGVLQNSLAMQVNEWNKEFRKYINLDLSTQARLRRTNDEILRQGYSNVTRNSPLDFIG